MLHLELTQMALPFLDAAVVDELVRRGCGRSDNAHNLLLVVERAHCPFFDLSDLQPPLSNLIYTFKLYNYRVPFKIETSMLSDRQKTLLLTEYLC
jgi:hypothetical protein